MVQIKVLLAIEKGWSSHYRSKHTQTYTDSLTCTHLAINASNSDRTARVLCINLPSDPYQGYRICQTEKKRLDREKGCYPCANMQISPHAAVQYS